MIKSKKPAADNLPYFRIFVGLLAVNLLAIILLFFMLKRLPLEVPLWYGRAFGEAQLADRQLIVLPLVASAGILVFNYVLLNFLRDSFLQKVLMGVSALVFILSLITVTRIFLLVGNL